MKKIFALLIFVAAAFQLQAQVAPHTTDSVTTPSNVVYVDTMQVALHPDTNQVYHFAEQEASFPGGQAAFYEYLKKEIHYPKEEKKAGKQGTVYVSFVVERDGRITNVKTIKGVAGAPGLSKEAERVIVSMPNWSPGKINGKTVRTSVTQPVKFVLPVK